MEEPCGIVPGSLVLCWTCGCWCFLNETRQPEPLNPASYRALSQDDQGMIIAVDRQRFAKIMQLAGGRFFHAV